MHREPLNQEIMNACNFVIIPIVMAIVFFLVVHPYGSDASFSAGVSELFTCLLRP
jgi:hypothetical protein